jgi:hypothetical protein
MKTHNISIFIKCINLKEFTALYDTLFLIRLTLVNNNFFSLCYTRLFITLSSEHTFD